MSGHVVRECTRVEARETSRLVQFTSPQSFESQAVSRRAYKNAIDQREDKTQAVVKKLSELRL